MENNTDSLTGFQQKAEYISKDILAHNTKVLQVGKHPYRGHMLCSE